MTDEGLRLKAEGQQLALDAAVPWKDQAREAIERLADSDFEFTSEHVIDIVGLPREDVGTNRNNAVGAAMTAAARAGLIFKVGYTTCKRPSSHGRVVTKWKGKR